MKMGRVQDGRMFDAADDEVVAAPLRGPAGPFDSEIGGFRAVGGKDDFFGRLGVNEAGGLGAGNLQCVARAQTVLVRRGGIAEGPGQEWLHRLQRLRQQRRGGLMVEIDVPHRAHSIFVCS
jgi:hypothetical protein